MGSASLELALDCAARPGRQGLKVCAAMLAGALGSSCIILLFYQIFNRHTPLALSLRGQGGQLRIGWDRTAAEGATLEILDGQQRTTLVVSKALADVTYAMTSSDVQVRLIPAQDDGGTEVARYLVQDPPVAKLAGEFAALLVQARELDRALSRQERMLAELESEARTLNVKSSPHLKTAKAAPAVTRWWR